MAPGTEHIYNSRNYFKVLNPKAKEKKEISTTVEITLKY